MMKKLSLLLALLMVATCCMLASCGGDTETADETSADASEEVSVEETVSSEAPAEESSEEPAEESSEVSDEPVVASDNLALGKSYTISQLYRQGGADKEWGWDDSADIAYPDEDNASLTDGKLAADDSLYGAEEWMGFHAKAPDYIKNGYSNIILDLGESMDISKLVLYVGGKKLDGGIGVPATVKFMVSEDGKTYTDIATVPPVDNGTSLCPVEQLCSVTGRYIQVQMTSAGWMFVCELEVY